MVVFLCCWWSAHSGLAVGALRTTEAKVWVHGLLGVADCAAWSDGRGERETWGDRLVWSAAMSVEVVWSVGAEVGAAGNPLD